VTTVAAALQTGTVSSGWHSITHDVSNWTRSLGTHIGPLEVAALVIAAVVLIVYAGISIASRPNRDLASMLAPYRLHPAEPPPSSGTPGDVVTVPALRRLAAALAGLAERRGVRDNLQRRLVRAGLPMGVGELLVICLLAGAVLLLLGGILAGVVGVIVALAIAILAPLAVLQAMADRRSRRFDRQLPDVLKLLAASLRAGFSLLQGLDSILSQVGDPIASELRQAFAATRVGAPVEDALEAAAQRVGSRDFTWAALAIRIQREVGGNLAEILDTVASTMVQRERLRREVRTLTAEGRISAFILSALPVAIGFMVYIVNRAYIKVLFNTLGGELALIGAVALEVLGIWWLYRTVQIDT